MIVTDTNIIAYLLLPGKYTETAKAALRKDSDWIAPLLWKSEFRNVLALYIRKKLMVISQATDIMAEAEQLMQGGEYSIQSSEIFSLVDSSGCTAYDCEYVVLAKEFNIPLITTDKKLLSSFPNIALSLEKYAQNT